jgi:hypothetical protein
VQHRLLLAHAPSFAVPAEDAPLSSVGEVHPYWQDRQ